ncbi:hypothetical protein PAPHI01_1556 [Pancytospora philotis]|nr:hypothetical protein PAPHI01_1556 [Pancytospora philotis]
MLLGICHMLVLLVHGRPGDDVEMAVEESGLQRDSTQEGSATKCFFTVEEAALLEWLFARNFMLRNMESSINNALSRAKSLDSRRHAVTIIVGACRQETFDESIAYLIPLVLGCDTVTGEMGPLFKLLSKLFTRDCIEYAREDPHYFKRREDKRAYANLYEMDLDVGRVPQIREALKDLAECFSAIKSASHPSASGAAATG